MRTVILAGVLCAVPCLAVAGPVERACVRSDRDGATRVVCACIQEVADMTLSGADQRRVAKFFRDPEAAEAARASDSRANEAFWQRYVNFGATAEAFCSAG